MKMPNRDLLVLLKSEFMSPRAIEMEVECLNDMLRCTESDEQFCIAHELVDRNRITSKHKKILKLAKGMQHDRRRSFRLAKQGILKALQYAYRDRRGNTVSHSIQSTQNYQRDYDNPSQALLDFGKARTTGANAGQPYTVAEYRTRIGRAFAPVT